MQELTVIIKAKQYKELKRIYKRSSQEIPVAIDWSRILNGSHFSKSKDREKGTKVIKPASLVGLGDYELKTTFSEE